MHQREELLHWHRAGGYLAKAKSILVKRRLRSSYNGASDLHDDESRRSPGHKISLGHLYDVPTLQALLYHKIHFGVGIVSYTFL